MDYKETKQLNQKDKFTMSENPNHSIALQSFPTPENQPNMLIWPKIFMISFRITTTNQKIHELLHSLKTAMKTSCDEAKNDLLRKHTRQVVQLRKEPEKSVYHLIIENISSRKAKEILMRGIQRIDLSHPISTSEVVNSQWNRAKNFETSDWKKVWTVLIQSREKDRLMVRQEGKDLKTQIYDPKTEMIKMTTWPVFPNHNKLKTESQVNPNHSIALQSFLTPKNQPNMLIRPKIFMISFRITITNQKTHESLHSLKTAMKTSCDEAKDDLLRGHTRQVVQLRKEPEESVYHLIIENISSEKAKEILIQGIQSIDLAQPIATSEVVNSQWNRAKLFETSDWGKVRTVALQSGEKCGLMVLQEGKDLETQIYNPETEMIKMTTWPVFPNNNKLKNKSKVMTKNSPKKSLMTS